MKCKWKTLMPSEPQVYHAADLTLQRPCERQKRIRVKQTPCRGDRDSIKNLAYHQLRLPQAVPIDFLRSSIQGSAKAFLFVTIGFVSPKEVQRNVLDMSVSEVTRLETSSMMSLRNSRSKAASFSSIIRAASASVNSSSGRNVSNRVEAKTAPGPR